MKQIGKEVEAFGKQSREIPDNFIIATNIDPSGVAQTGSFDKANKLIKNFSKKNGKRINFHIWGGSKIISLLSQHKEATEYYSHLLTPGHVLSAMHAYLSDLTIDLETIIEYLVVNQFGEQQHMKLDQAGSASDARPGIHNLFIDVPFFIEGGNESGMLLKEMVGTASQCHRYSLQKKYPDRWSNWSKSASRSRTLVVKGGPGQGKSTAGQYMSQIQRAALLLKGERLTVIDKTLQKADEIRRIAEKSGFWPTQPRIPISIELKEFAQWFGERQKSESTNVLAFVSQKIQKRLGQSVPTQSLKRAIATQSWLIVFDGLDEVPNNVKDKIAEEIVYFVNETLVSIDADALTICTSRPQGYSGQFSALDSPILRLSKLDVASALRCAEPVVGIDRTLEEQERSMEVLRAALESESVQELMTTPLQAHIMAVVVRGGGRPPERRWQLFDNFYQVMKKRESLKSFPNPRIAKLLREDDKLLKNVHARLGFVLHARAEHSEGAETHLSRAEFKDIVTQAVKQMEVASEVDATVAALMEATTERLVLVSTPESGDQVKFDIRQLQEFFAAEFIYKDVSIDELSHRLSIVCGDAHWREVMHFMLSALFESARTSEIAVAKSVLDALNIGDEPGPAEICRRKMARGSLMAARLLAEGVLEQDKRRRHQLQNVLRPIAGVADRSAFEILEHITPQNSKQWLIDFLLSILDEVNPLEGVAAVAILGKILPEKHAKSENLIDKFLNFPSFAIDIVLRAWASSDDYNPRSQRSSSNLSSWAREAIIKLIISPISLSLDKDAIRSLLLRIIMNKQLNDTISDMGFGNFEQLAIDILRYRRELRPTDTKGVGVAVNYGILMGHYFDEDWATKNAALPSKIREMSKTKPSDGILEVLRLSCVFICSRKLSDFNALIKKVGVDRLDIIRSLPSEVMRYIPIHETESQIYCNYIFETDEEDSCLLEMSYSPGCRPFKDLMIENGVLNHKNWSDLVTDLPAVALQFWFHAEAFDIRMPDWVYTKQCADSVMHLCEQYPKEAARFVIGWGRIIDVDPNYQARLLSVAARVNGHIDSYSAAGEGPSYNIVLPRDMPIF